MFDSHHMNQSALRHKFPHHALAHDKFTRIFEREAMMPHIAFVVEATRNERGHLWDAHSKTRPWSQILSGYGVNVGTFGGMPVFISLMFDVIDGHLVLFWEATSQVVDYRLIETWLAANVPALTTTPGQRKRTTDATNFHLCLHHLQALNEATKQESAAVA